MLELLHISGLLEKLTLKHDTLESKRRNRMAPLSLPLSPLRPSLKLRLALFNAPI